jgi:hypothetical protein
MMIILLPTPLVTIADWCPTFRARYSERGESLP